MNNHIQISDSSIIDQFEITGIDCEGDDRETLIVLSFDIDSDCYFIEQFLDGNSQECESFDDLAEATRAFPRWVKNAEKHYASEKHEFERCRVNITVNALRDILQEQGEDLDPDAARAIGYLASIISRGHGNHVADDLKRSSSTVYRYGPKG